MMVEMAFVIFLGLLVFGPRKTLEMSQSVGRHIAHFKRAASQMLAQVQAELLTQPNESKQSALLTSVFKQKE